MVPAAVHIVGVGPSSALAVVRAAAEAAAAAGDAIDGEPFVHRVLQAALTTARPQRRGGKAAALGLTQATPEAITLYTRACAQRTCPRLGRLVWPGARAGGAAQGATTDATTAWPVFADGGGVVFGTSPYVCRVVNHWWCRPSCSSRAAHALSCVHPPALPVHASRSGRGWDRWAPAR